MSSYGYQRLRAREIRLLHVLGGGIFRPTRYEIHHKNLDNSLEYEALSYTWGDEPPTKSIRIGYGGIRFHITSTLDTALRALRFVDRTRVLWVDAVCINQKDDEEKSEQVGMMCDIYRQAKRVVAWVGEEKPEDKAVLDIEKYLHIPSEDFLTHEELRTWSALTTFIQRSLFSRVWVVQELAVAKKLTIYYGRNEMEWDTLQKGLFKFLDRMGLFLNTLKEDVSLERVFTFVSIRNLVTKHSREQQEPQSQFHKFQLSRIDDNRVSKEVKVGDLLHFVTGTRHLGSRDPRDHIFALLGLVLSEDKKEIQINYAKELQFSVVYREFARVMIVQHGNLDVLSQARLHNTLPSWVPDWSRQMERYPLTTGAYSASGSSPENGGSFRLKSMGREEFQDVLKLNGIVVDTIRSLIVSNTADSGLLERIDFRKLKVELPFVAIKTGKNPFNSVQAIPTFLQSRAVRIEPELVNQWYQAAWRCEQAYSSRSGGWDHELAYIQTLIGDLPFKQLEPFHEALVSDCFEIWREWLCEDPITSHGIFSKGYWTGKAKTGMPLIKLKTKLIDLFSQHGQHSWLSRERSRNEKKGRVQVNSSTHVPIFLNKSIHELWPLLRTYEVRSDEKSIEGLRHDAASVKLYYARMFSGAVERMARNRQFCVTGKGFMGWVPSEAEKNDVVCLLEGGRVPYILRPDDGGEGRYRLVGEAYIHGLMHGEGWVGKMEKISLI